MGAPGVGPNHALADCIVRRQDPARGDPDVRSLALYGRVRRSGSIQRGEHDTRVRDGVAARAVHARSCRAQAPPPAHAHAAARRPRVGGRGVRGAAAAPGWRCAGRRALRRRRWPCVPALQATRHAPHARACRVRLGADGAAAGQQEAAELEQRRHAAASMAGSDGTMAHLIGARSGYMGVGKNNRCLNHQSI